MITKDHDFPSMETEFFYLNRVLACAQMPWVYRAGMRWSCKPCKLPRCSWTSYVGEATNALWSNVRTSGALPVFKKESIIISSRRIVYQQMRQMCHQRCVQLSSYPQADAWSAKGV
jgi:hypothetical protein